jgi:hypothetical protein
MKKFFMLAGLAAAGLAHGQVFDAITGVSTVYYSSGIYNLEGESIALTGSSNTLIGMDLAFRNMVAANYTDLQVQVSIFSTATNASSGSGNAFGGTVTTFTDDLGAQNLAAGGVGLIGTASAPGFKFSAPVTVGSTMGIQILYLANTGSGLIATQNIQTYINATTAPAAGANGTPGAFYANTSTTVPGSSTTSLKGSDLVTFGSSYPNENLYIRLYPQAVPEPISLTLLGLGSTLLLRRRRA